MLEYIILFFSITAGILLGRALAHHRRKKKHSDQATSHNPAQES